MRRVDVSATIGTRRFARSSYAVRVTFMVRPSYAGGAVLPKPGAPWNLEAAFGLCGANA